MLRRETHHSLFTYASSTVIDFDLGRSNRGIVSEDQLLYSVPISGM
jgi:hypothetical protein